MARRFQSLVDRLVKTRHMKRKNAEKLSAWIGRKKYGKRKFQRMAVAGRRHK